MNSNTTNNGKPSGDQSKYDANDDYTMKRGVVHFFIIETRYIICNGTTCTCDLTSCYYPEY